MLISVEEYAQNKDKFFTLDVRTRSEFKMLPHFEWAVNIHIDQFLDDFKKYLDEFNPDKKPIVTVCNAGNRSGQVANFLNQLGYDARTLKGGIYNYNKKIR
ncbi:rhodanese-like domain-containing protein [Spiroplasma endosymbiont of Diplazon laetatorius]|uniref:rhodanese-like domain-containing protein n=1 Tax=Spiroplasma endosymbiont of Diplazon laetatorius TaxID=3066322 RepID=UPI0030CADFF5